MWHIKKRGENMDKYISGFGDNITYTDYLDGYNLHLEYFGAVDIDTGEEDIYNSYGCEISLNEVDADNKNIMDMLAEYMTQQGYEVNRGADVSYISYIREHQYISIMDYDSPEESQKIAETIKAYLEQITAEGGKNARF